MARFMALPMSFIENMFRYARNPTNKRAQLFHDVSQYFIGNRSTKRTKDPHRMFVSPDSVCLACVLDESVIIERKRVDGYVVPFGSNSAGHMTVNWTRQHQQHSNVDIVTKMDMEKFKVLFFRICLSS